MKLFIYNASLENEKDIEERQKLIEQIKIIDERIKQRTIIFSGLLKGIIISKNKKSSQSENIKLISGGEQMKYKGITIFKHKTCDTWYARYRQEHKQYYISAKTQIDCYNKLKIALKTPPQKKTKNITLLQWFNKWLELYKQDRKQNTINDYYKTFKYLESIKNKELAKITTIDVIEILNNIQFERRKQIVYELLNALYEKAITNEITNKNPLKNIDKPKHKKTHGNALTNEDEQKLIKILEEKQKDIFLITLYQGFRLGEVLALTGKDIDLEKRTITINKAINEFNELDKTKTEYSDRIVPMFENSYRILLKYKNTNDRLFKQTYKGVQNSFTKIIKNYFNNKKYSTKSLRHTFITKCQEQGIPLHIIQKWVGHIQGSEVTNKVYTHPRTEKEEESIKIINNIKN